MRRRAGLHSLTRRDALKMRHLASITDMDITVITVTPKAMKWLVLMPHSRKRSLRRRTKRKVTRKEPAAKKTKIIEQS